jgi:endonuclease/exonuclease/phosphatase family metal-dependent hydrolase
MLNKYDIESAYHYHFKEDFGNEKNHTFFMHKKKEKPYHTDYIFLKKNTIENLKEFSVGKHDGWIKYSDHVPLLIEI